MSRAFVRESDAYPEPLPDRPISPHPNFVTRRGLAAIEARVRELDVQRAGLRAGEDMAQRAGIERELRYWSSRRASARVVEPQPSERVRFGMLVTLRLACGATQAFRLVGEDEADASCGLISWMAPLAQALLGREAGESVTFQGGEAEIISIEP
ncbi:MAG TPA: GreA/GreB family elongation factor [Steroidobacteraceae bacterium]|jgi:transcription elongation GreA/GreB family factor|nr:GreA/GreB family elongation factor [Steroidobacteraceae bacterium]